MAKKKTKKAPTTRITIEDGEKGIKFQITNALSRDHVLYLLSQAQIQLLLESNQEGEENAVQELPTTDAEEAPHDL